MAGKEDDFSAFLGAESKNLYGSFHNYGRLVWMVRDIEGYISEILMRFGDKRAKALLGFARYNTYIALSAYMRGHPLAADGPMRTASEIALLHYEFWRDTSLVARFVAENHKVTGIGSRAKALLETEQRPEIQAALAAVVSGIGKFSNRGAHATINGTPSMIRDMLKDPQSAVGSSPYDRNLSARELADLLGYLMQMFKVFTCSIAKEQQMGLELAESGILTGISQCRDALDRP